MEKSNKSLEYWDKMVKMIKILFKIIGILLSLIVLLLVWYDQSRTFYCLSNDKCVTVWKRLGGKCYIVLGKYYGLLTPSDNYIQTTNTKYLTLYFSSDIPNSVIVRDQGSSTGIKEKYHIVNNNSKSLRIVEYSEEYKNILYKSDAVKSKDVKASTDYIDLNIKENYATDKTGEKIE